VCQCSAQRPSRFFLLKVLTGAAALLFSINVFMQVMGTQLLYNTGSNITSNTDHVTRLDLSAHLKEFSRNKSLKLPGNLTSCCSPTGPERVLSTLSVEINSRVAIFGAHAACLNATN